jgi:NAD-dependent DNA ligase
MTAIGGLAFHEYHLGRETPMDDPRLDAMSRRLDRLEGENRRLKRIRSAGTRRQAGSAV